MSSPISSPDNAEGTTVDHPCDHLFCPPTEECFDAILTKVQECDAELMMESSMAHPFLHFGRFLSFWMSQQNKPFVDVFAARIYMSQAAFYLLRDKVLLDFLAPMHVMATFVAIQKETVKQ